MAHKPENVETIQQWGIKSISKRVVDEITSAAPKMEPKHTHGQLVEKVWDFWKGNGALQQAVDVVGDMTKLLTAAGPWTEHNQLPAEARSFINSYARAARKSMGKPEQQPSITDARNHGQQPGITRLPNHPDQHQQSDPERRPSENAE